MSNFSVGTKSAGGNSGKIRASHLLIKHRESRRPSSWKSDKITRSKEEARSILEKHENAIKSGETTLSQLAMTESDCSSARKGGDLYVMLPLFFLPFGRSISYHRVLAKYWAATNGWQ